MADVGVLNLQIHDNSQSAVTGLNNLKSALERVRDAVNGAKLGTFAGQLQRLNRALAEGTTDNLNGLAGALKSIQEASNFSMPNISGLGKLKKQLDGMDSAGKLGAVREQAVQMSADFESMESRIASTVEGTVSESTEHISGYLEDVSKSADAANKEMESSFEQVSQRTREAMTWDPATGDFTKPLSQARQEMEQMNSRSADIKTAFQAAQFGNLGENAKKWARGIEDVSAAAKRAETQIDALLSKLNATPKIDWASSIDRMMGIGGPMKSAEESMNAFMGDAAQRVSNLMETLNETPKIDWSHSIDRMLGIGAPVKSAEESMNAFINGMSGMDDVARSVRELNPELAALQDNAGNAGSALESLRSAMGGIKSGVSRILSPLSKMISSFARIAKYRAMRAALKQITEGLKEGVENYYHYSQAINSSFAPSMDSAAASLAQMRNSFGSALGPAISSVIPLLNAVASAAMVAVNALSQFFALLRGQTSWTRAVPVTTKAFDKVKKSAGGAGSAMKDLLADWDELNIIQNEGGGGGGGGGALAMEEYMNMFEEVTEFDSKIRKIVDFIKGNMDDVLKTVRDIGIGILGWKMSTAFTGPLAALGSLIAAGAVIAVTLRLTRMFDSEYMKTGDPGWLIADAVTNVVGATLAGKIIGDILGGGVGVLTAGIVLTISGGVSYGIALNDPESDRAGVLQTLGLVKGLIGMAAIGAGFGIASGSALLGVVSALTLGAPLFVLSAKIGFIVEQDKKATQIAKEAFAATGEGGISVAEIMGALQDEFDSAAEGYQLVVKAFENVGPLKTDLVGAFMSVNMLSATIRGGGKLTQEEANEFKQAWSTVFSAFEGITSASFDTVFEALNKSLSSENEEIRKQAKELRVSLLAAKEEITSAFAEFKIETEELGAKVAKGTATQEETTQYFANLEALATATSNSASSFEKFLEKNGKIDFGDADHALDNVKQFVADVSEAAGKASEEIEAGRQTALEALDAAWIPFEVMKNAGKLSEADYKAYQALFDGIRENIEAAANKEQDKVTETMQKAYGQVLKQAFSGLNNLPDLYKEDGQLNMSTVSKYMDTVMTPIIGALQDAGVELDEETKRAFGIGLSMEDLFNDPDRPEFVRQYIEKMLAEENVGEAVSEATQEAIEAAPTPDIQTDANVHTNVNETIDYSTQEATGVGTESMFAQTEEDLAGLEQSALAAESTVNGISIEPLSFDPSAAIDAADNAALAFKSMASRIKSAVASLMGINFSLGFFGGGLNIFMPFKQRASGGPVKSGDLVMANENGNFEMMGRMGNQPVVANNQQIVAGISSGVAAANIGLETRMGNIERMLAQVITGGITARAKPSSDWGAHGAKSATQYSRVTGY